MAIRELTPDTRIKLSKIIDLHQFVEDQQGVKADLGEYTTRKDGVYRKVSDTKFAKVNTYKFPNEKSVKGSLKDVAKNARPATADGSIDFSDFDNSVNRYLIHMRDDWNDNVLNSPLFDNARIRFDGDSFHHFYFHGRNRRPQEELEARAKCLPYIRNILESSGIEGCCSVDKDNHLGYVVMGRATIDGKDTAIKIIITKKKKGKLFYLSVNNFGEI